MYFHATEDLESLLDLADVLANYSHAPAPLALPTSQHAVDALLRLGEQRPVTVVLDEFPYLVRSSRSLPSVIQAAFASRRQRQQASRTRLILCGSALGEMQRRLSGPAPLRGRAPSSERTFDDWVCRTVLDPSSPLRPEARALVAEDLSATRRRCANSAGATQAPRTAPGSAHQR